jgi:hypothetical protein
MAASEHLARPAIAIRTLLAAALTSAVIALAATAVAVADETPATDSDVVVIGGTPGGVAAAVVAARLGHSVTLVEHHARIGGMAASGLGWSDIEDRRLVQGLFREFVDRVKDHYVAAHGPGSPQVDLCKDGYHYEPKVTESVLRSFVAESPRITLLTSHALVDATMNANRPVAVRVRDRRTSDVRTLRGKVFVDATYEGDLLAATGVAFRLGREPRDEFGEPHAGEIYADLEGRRLGGSGKGDDRLPAYTFRVVLTDDPANRVPLAKPPDGYDRTRYLGYLDDLASGRFGTDLFTTVFSVRQLPNGKVELNMKPKTLGFVFAEENAGYIPGDWSARDRITARIRDLSLGLLWFVQTDAAVPEKSRSHASRYGLCRDEFADTGHFPFQLYVREGRRLVGEYTLSERNVTEQPGVTSERRHADAVAVGDYPIDSFPTRKRQPGGDFVLLEGYLGMLHGITRPYQYPYRIMVPKLVDGLIAPVPASATHVAFSAIRMEPTWMALGQAAGVAAHLAITGGTEIRGVPISDLQRILREQGAVLDLPE